MTDIQPTKDWLTTLVTALERHHLNIAEQIVRNYPDEVLAAIRAETAKNSGEAVNGAPERICVAQDSDGFWTCREAVLGSQEYVRADIERDWRYEALRLKALLAATVNSPAKNSGEVADLGTFIAWLTKHDWRICTNDYSGGWHPLTIQTATLLSMYNTSTPANSREKVPDAWTRIAADPELANARRKLSIHEIRLIIKHALEVL